MHLTPFLSWKKLSTTFHLSPPDELLYIEDVVFQVGIIATYLGQLCPLMSQVVGLYFGKGGEQLD
jgi:hypothetical protein